MHSGLRTGPCHPSIAERADYRMVRSLTALEAGQANGILEVCAGEQFASLYLLRGRVVFAESGTLGLVQTALGAPIGAQDYAQVVRTMTERLVDSEQMRFSEAVVALGLVGAHEVYEALAAQVRDWAMACLAWDDTACSFTPTEEALSEVAHFPQPLEALLLDAIERHYDHERIACLLTPLLGEQVRTVAPAAVIGAVFGLDPAELRWLAACDGARTVRQLWAESSLAGLQAGRLLAALLLTDFFDVPGTPATNSVPQPPVRTHAERTTRALLADHEQVRRALGLRSDGSDAELRDAVTKKLQQLRRVLRAPVRLSRLDALARVVVPPIDRAREHFVAGKYFLEQQQHARAAEEFGKAAELEAISPVYKLYACWAEYRSARSDRDRVRRATELSVLWKAAAAHDRNLAFAHFVAAQLAMLEHDLPAARKALRRAHELDPQDVETERHLRLVQRRITTLSDG